MSDLSASSDNVVSQPQSFSVAEVKRGQNSYTSICSTWGHPPLMKLFEAHAKKRQNATMDDYIKSFVTQFYGGSKQKIDEGLVATNKEEFLVDNLLPYYYLHDDFNSRMAEKRRFSRDVIIEYFPIRSGGRILEIGSAFGITSYEMLKRGYKVTALEPSGFASSIARRALDRSGVLSNSNLEIVNVGIPDGLSALIPNSFDAVLAPNVFEHIPDPVYLASLRPFYDLLSPGGLLCIVAPDGHQDLNNLIKNPEYGKQLASATHFAVKSLAYYTTTCLAAGYSIKTALFAGKPSYPRCIVAAEKPQDDGIESKVQFQPRAW